MIRNDRWSTGIVVDYRYAGQGAYGWTAKADYLGDGFCDDVPGTAHISTEGTLRTRYAVRNAEDGTSSLGAVIDVIKADAERMGVTWTEDVALYVEGEGESHDDFPDGWRAMIREQAARWLRDLGEGAHSGVLAEDSPSKDIRHN